MTREEAIKELTRDLSAWERDCKSKHPMKDALRLALEALKHEDHDGCDGCRYEANHELSLPCIGCKQNYVDKYVPMPEHDREWIIGCIKHDGFVKTDRGDKANQIILDALSADRPRGEWIDMADFEQCSECGGTHLKEVDTYYGKATWIKTDFCPNCGADMRGEDE